MLISLLDHYLSPNEGLVMTELAEKLDCGLCREEITANQCCTAPDRAAAAPSLVMVSACGQFSNRSFHELRMPSRYQKLSGLLTR